MKSETYQLAGNAAQVYESQKVPAIFAPLAEATLDAVTLDANDVILDVACGTGIVARTARGRLGPGPRIVGTDLNEGMIATARSLVDEHARSCEWYLADVTALPFPDATFSLAICQQGVQFFPDVVAALHEIRRVVRRDGRVVLSIWAGASALFTALAAALSRHVSDEIGARSLAPFAYDDAERLAMILRDVGCMDISTTTVTVDRIIRNPESAIPKEILANPVGPAVEERGAEIMHRIVADTLADLSAYRHESFLVVPQRAYLLQAKVR